MNIVFIGAVRFSASMLEELIRIKAPISGVCTLENSIENSDHTDLSKIAGGAGIPVRYTPDINSAESIAWIKSFHPDVIFCLGWSRLISKELLAVPGQGVVGYHPTALPKNRGRHPIIWTLVLGLRKTASTFFMMDEGADSGDILLQEFIDVLEADNAESLYKKCVSVAKRQLVQLVIAMEKGKLERSPQNHSMASYWRKRTINDGEIDWRMSAASIFNLVRGLTKPYPGAHFTYKNEIVKVWCVEQVNEPDISIEPGKVISIQGGNITVKAGEGAIRLIDYEPISNIAVGDYI